MSFFLDGWMLLGLGIGIAIACKVFYKEDSFLKYWLSMIILVIFYTISVSLLCELDSADNIILGTMNESFFNMLKSMYPDYYANHPDATSCEFMFSSGLEWLKDWSSPYAQGVGQWIGSIFKTEVPFDNLEQLVTGHPMYLFGGIVMFSLYPAFLYIGTQLGFLLFGRKPGDKGVIGFL